MLNKMFLVLLVIFFIFGIIIIILILFFRIIYLLFKVFNIVNYFFYNILWFNFIVKFFIIILFKIKRYDLCNKMYVYFKKKLCLCFFKMNGF